MGAGRCPKCDASYGKGSCFCKKCGLDFRSATATESPEHLTSASLDKFIPPNTDETHEEASDVGESTPASPIDDKTGDLFEAPEESVTATFLARVVAGLDAGKAVRIENGTSLVLGKGVDADMSLRDECVSRRHATLRLDHGKLYLSDANSTNGTFLRIDGTRQLMSGDCFVLGGTVIRVEQEGSVMARRLARGETIGAYSIFALLGAGGEGDVYEALAPDGCHCAVKQLKFSAGDPGHKPDRERAFRLQKLIGRRSPHVVEILDVFVHDDLVYKAMELITGRTLEERLAAETRLSPDEMAPIVRDILTGLDWLHGEDIVHRDIKPSNVVLVDGSSGVAAVIVDLGIALDRNLSRLTYKGGINGTPEYAAPEMIRGGATTIDGRSDIYCLGATLFHALTGQIPILSAGFPVRPTFINELHAPVRPSIRDLVPDLPESLDCYVQRLMSVRPDDRPQSAKEALHEFELALVGGSKTRSFWPSSVEPEERPPLEASTAARPPSVRVHKSKSTGRECLLRIETGPKAGETISIPPNGVTIGRTTVNPDDRSISRFHCRIVPKKSGIRVRDCGALNGLIFREHRVHHARLVPGETLTLGETTLRFL